jgi:hypothetical protein
MSQSKMQAAKELIQEKNYDAARNLLRTIDDPKARDWLVKLDKIKPEQKSSRLPVIVIAVSFLGLVGLSIAFIVVFQERSNLLVELAGYRSAATLSVSSGTPVITAPTQAGIAPTITSAASGKWRASTDTSAMTGAESVFLHLDAEEPVATWLGSTTPELILRCDDASLDAYLAANSQLEADYDAVYIDVLVRFGDEAPYQLTMSKSTDGSALFFRNTRDIINQMLQYERIVIEYTPYNVRAVEAVFDLRGLADVVQPLLDACPA